MFSPYRLQLRRAPSSWPRAARRLGLCLALAGGLLGVSGPRPALAVALVVDKAADDSGGACTAGPNDCSLRSAVNIANTNGVTDTISFASNFTITLGSTLQLTATGTTIQTLPGQIVEINANDNGQAFYITASDTTLEGLRIYGSSSGTTNVWIAGTAQRVRIANNIIGDDDLGFVGACGNSPNSHSGIYITSSANPAGSDALAWIYGNHIKCNAGSPGHGIHISGSREVVIGADSAGNAGSAQDNFVMLNAGHGVVLEAGATQNTIRNSYLQYNLSGSGLVIDGSDSNQVYGNHLQANDGQGLRLSGGSSLNSIGCPLFAGDPNDTSLRNVIHLNSGDGVLITGAGTDSNLILCNWIGLNDAGTGPAGNELNGVHIDGAAEDNIIGAGATTRNVISGNGRSGVYISDGGTSGNLVQGNYIGTNAAGAAVVGNGWDGVTIISGATQNTVGGTSATTLNVIGGNSDYGILVAGSGTATNTIKFNDIGLNSLAGNTPLPNESTGLRLADGAHGQSIGGPAAANYIAFNGGDGVSVEGGAYANTFADNRVFSNTLSGVALDGAGTTGNIFSQFHSYGNGHDGIAERNSATGNRWQVISIYNNGGLGIDKAATGSTNTPTLPYPIITSVNVGTGLVQGTASASALVELYRAAPDALGFGEGKTFLGSTTANGAGAWSINVGPGLLNCYTAFQTVSGASSEFGPHTCPTVRLPFIAK